MSALYYHADSSNQIQGPLTLEELIELRKRGAITNATLVAELGSHDWRPFASLLPQPNLAPPAPPVAAASPQSNPSAGTQRTCPKCASMILVGAKVCSACQFPVSDYDENRRSVKFNKMEQIPYREEDLDEALLKIYKGKNGGCIGVGIIIGGTLALLIPIIGWVVAPMCWLFGFFVLLVPVRGLRYAEKITQHQEYQKNVQLGKIMLHNRFRNVTCPKCGHRELEISWQQEGGFWDCPGCQKRLLREADHLFYLPNPMLFQTIT